MDSMLGYGSFLGGAAMNDRLAFVLTDEHKNKTA
jgi:hypothetical protein